MFAFVGLRARPRRKLRAFGELVTRWPLVREAYAISGEGRFPAEMRGARLDGIAGFHHPRTHAAPNVENVKTTLILRVAKYEPGVPILDRHPLSSSRGGWFGLVSSTLTAVVIGFASTILVIMEAARNVGATPSQQASWAAALCIGMAVSSFILSWRYRMPMITAWSTPGAVLITSGAGITYANALGAFVVAGVLMVVAGLIKPLERAIEKIPAPVAAAMLAGVLLRYTLGVPGAALAMPLLVLPLIVVFFALRLSLPLYAVPVIVVMGVVLSGLSGGLKRKTSPSASRRWNGRRRPSTCRPSCRSACRSPRHHGFAETFRASRC